MAVNKTTDNPKDETPAEQSAQTTGHTTGEIQAMKPGTPVEPVTGVELGNREPDAPKAAHTIRVDQHVATLTDVNEAEAEKTKADKSLTQELGEFKGSVYDFAKSKGMKVNDVYRQTGQAELIKKRIDSETGELVDIDYEA